MANFKGKWINGEGPTTESYNSQNSMNKSELQLNSQQNESHRHGKIQHMIPLLSSSRTEKINSRLEIRLLFTFKKTFLLFYFLTGTQ